MKKIIISIMCCLLSVIFFASCSCNGEEPPIVATSDSLVDKVRFTRGIHDKTAPETDKMLVEDGATQYKILLPQETDSNLMFAKDELFNRFFEATGARLETEVESETGKTHQAGEKYISLGNTKMAESANLDIQKDVLGLDGVRIITKDDTIYILGGDENGVLYGVYDFLEIYFDYDWYYYDCYDLNTGIKDLKLRNFNVTDVPDVEMRMGFSSYTSLAQNRNNAIERFRFNKYSYSGGSPKTVFINGIHNTYALINKDVENYDKYGDKWMSSTGEQLCYTAHGDPEAYSELVRQLSKKLQDAIIGEVDKGWGRRDLSITIEDNVGYCVCDECKREEALYGAKTGSVIKLCNAVMADIKDRWFVELLSDEDPTNDKYADDKFRCCFFAYSGMLKPPTTTYNEASKKYEVNFPELVMRYDVGTYYCFSLDKADSCTGMDFYAPINEGSRIQYAQWADISSYMHTWGYQANFYNYLDTYHSLDYYSSDLFQFVIDKGISMWWNQGIRNDSLTAFDALKEYIQSKLMWDCTLDDQMLKDKFFKAMYGEAADIMKEMLEYSNDIHMTHKIESTTLTGSFNNDGSAYQVLPVLEARMAYCDKAHELIASLYKDTDPERYETLSFHIEQEWFSPAYHLYKCQIANFNENEKQALGQRIYNIGTKMGKISVAEGSGNIDWNSYIGG